MEKIITLTVRKAGGSVIQFVFKKYYFQPYNELKIKQFYDIESIENKVKNVH